VKSKRVAEHISSKNVNPKKRGLEHQEESNSKKQKGIDGDVIRKVLETWNTLTEEEKDSVVSKDGLKKTIENILEKFM
jgi:hypothetical protein